MFQATVISGDSLEFNSLIYPPQHSNTFNYIRSNLSQIPQQLIGAGKELFQRAVQTYNNHYNDRDAQRTRNAIKASGSTYFDNVVLPLLDINQIQQASLFMQRWVMAEPTIREIYQDQRCDGYSATYVDAFPGKVGDDHYDYRRVMDGVVLNDPEDTLVAKFYMDDIYEGDREELSHGEKVDILSTWEIVKIALQSTDRDPTSLFDGRLG